MCCATTPGSGLAPAEVARRVAGLPGLRLRGVFTHAGQAYGAETPERLAQIGQDEGQRLLQAAEALRAVGLPVEEVSVGSTPTAYHVMAVPGVTEVRPGNYVFRDASQLSLGACTLQDCALTVLATVVSTAVPGQAGRPAIDAGNPATCLPTDQRGVARAGACDIGAYEYTTPGTATSLSVGSGSGQRALPLFAFPKSLKAVALDSQGSPVPNVNINFTAPASGASGTFANTGTNNTSVLTDAGGVATTSIFTANSQFGSYNVSASASGLSSVNFSLENAGWYVSLSGNDSNTCSTPGSPCLTINGAIGKAMSNDSILVATGTYTGTGTEVVLINKSITLSGGWNVAFTAQTGKSTLDGQNTRQGIKVISGVTASLDRFIIKNGSTSRSGSSLSRARSTSGPGRTCSSTTSGSRRTSSAT